jgi:hypothetical protein
MAQAPAAGGGGAPRTNKTVKQFAGMNTQNHRNAVPEGQFAWLENIQPIGPGNLHSIPGRGLSLVRIPPSPPGGCPDSYPVAQSLPVVCCFITDDWGELSNNNAGSISFVDTDQSFWVTVSEQTGFGSGPYPNAVPTRTWYLLEHTGAECDLDEATPVTLSGHTANFQATQTAQAGVSGKSDEKSYTLVLANISPLVLGSNEALAYFGEDSGSSLLKSAANKAFGRTWAKDDDRFYSMIYGFASNDKEFAYWGLPAPNGTYETFSLPMETIFGADWDDSVQTFSDLIAIHYSSSYLYVVLNITSGLKIYRLQKATLTVVDSWQPTGEFSSFFEFYVLNDDLIYLIRRDGMIEWRIAYFRPSTENVTFLGSVPIQCNQSGLFAAPAFQYRDGYFHIGDGGSGIGDANVLKVGPLLCPSDPTLPFIPPS